jgi:hypothetical protein
VRYDQYIYDVLVTGVDGADSPQLTKGDPYEEDGVTYETLEGGSIPAGETIVIKLSGLPQDTNQQTVLWVLVTLVVLGGAFALLLRRSSNRGPITVPDNKEQQLLNEIARLDDEFEDGLIDEESYHLERGTLKTRIMRMRQGSGGD